MVALTLPLQILMAKMMEQGPVLVLAFSAQQLTRTMAAEGGGVENVSGDPLCMRICACGE